MFWSTAYAQAAAVGAAKPGVLEMFFPVLLIMGVFYFVIGRPQQKRAKEHQLFLTQIKRGDKVLTASGIFGEIYGVSDKFVTLEVAENVRIRVLRTQVAGYAKAEGAS